MFEVAHERTSIAVCKENRLNMSKNDIDVGIVFQKEELKELIKAIENALFISNLTVFPAPSKNAELIERMNGWDDKNMNDKVWAHLGVLREVLDNETN